MNPLHLLGEPFIQHALAAGTAIALLSGLVGYFVVLRGQVFAGDALSHVSYTGALAALAAGVDLRFGLFAATVLVGLVLGLLGGRAGADDAVIGVVFAWVLGLGVFFLTYYTSHASTGNGTASATVLFGSILGISRSAAITAVLVAAGLLLVLAGIARPLLFASLDPQVARARGVPVGLLGPAFLMLLGATAAETAQAVGALLLFGLLAAPPAAAMRLTTRPWRALALSGGLAVAAVWIGVALAYAWPALPASFTIMATATAEYLLAAGWSLRAGRSPSRGMARRA
ncbi:MAG TPA: metal ABC transporter permease [Jatrophihabitans sp.]|nr:metal ABC transporter permease [Jatrophihabitans sp.]